LLLELALYCFVFFELFDFNLRKQIRVLSIDTIGYKDLTEVNILQGAFLMKNMFAVALLFAGLAGFVISPWIQGQPSPAPTTKGKDIVSYRDVVKKVLPSVVSIESKAKPVRLKDQGQKRRNQLPDNPQIPEEFRKFFEEFKNRNGEESPNETPGGFGSGFIVEPNGVIVTNYHVVEGADKVEVTLNDGRKFTSTDIKGDPKTDLAIVRINAKNLPFLQFGDSDESEIGDRVLALGAPFGLTGSVTSGIISAKGRSLKLNFYEDFLQTDAAINPGNSGGPLVNLDGQVIGVNSAIKTKNGGFQGVGMAITSKLTKTVKEQLLKDGVVRRGYLGVAIKDIEDEQVAIKLGLKNPKGVIITQVMEDGPAGKGGIQSGDIIIEVGGKIIQDSKDLQFSVASLPLDKASEFKVVRDGKEIKVNITITEQPKQFGLSRGLTPRTPEKPTIEGDTNLDKLGIEVGQLNSDLGEKFGYKPNTLGVIIIKVDRESLGYQAGLRVGMVINKVDKKEVKSSTEVKELTEKANYTEGVLFQVLLPDGAKDYILVKKD